MRRRRRTCSPSETATTRPEVGDDAGEHQRAPLEASKQVGAELLVARRARSASHALRESRAERRHAPSPRAERPVTQDELVDEIGPRKAPPPGPGRPR